MGFFESFIKLNATEATDLAEWHEDLKNADFRNFIIEKKGKNFKTVKLLSANLLPCMQKPQQLIYDDPEYYIAIDTYTYTYYVCYKRLLMIDLDYSKSTHDKATILKKVNDYCTERPELFFRVFETRNGLHLFLASQPMDYQSKKAIKLMLALDCDFYYTIFAYIRGWSVRLNRKADDHKDDLYREIEPIGTGKSDQLLDKLINLHINLMKVFQNEQPNLMK